jgi:hypothetical protein
MSAQPDNSPRVRRVVLPSGKTIEVVLFEDAVVTPEATMAPSPAPEPEPAAPAEKAESGPTTLKPRLHMCGQCDSSLVYPLQWEEADSSRWQVTLRCPNCQLVHSGIYEQDVVDAFDEELDSGTAALVRDAERLSAANMADAVERFVAALNADHIVPADF